MICIGIDPGYAHFSLAVLKRVPNGYQGLEAVPVTTSSKQPSEERLRAIWDVLGRAIRTHHPALVAIEDQVGVAVGMRRSAAKEDGWQAGNTKVDEVVGLVKGCCLAYGAPWLLVSPQTVKVALLGRGSRSADKKRVQAAARMLCPGLRLSQHSADAVGVAVAGLQRWPPR